MRKDITFVERTTRANRKELLDKALGECLLELRKKFYPYQRHSFLFDEVEINERDLTDLNALGLYEWDKKTFTHNIYINTRQIKQAQKCKDTWSCGYSFNSIKRTIKHELIHAFVQENWEYRFSSIKEKNNDASPIFLAILEWSVNSTNHDCYMGFKKSNLYKQVETTYNCEKGKYDNSNFKTYKDLQKYLSELLQDYYLNLQSIKDWDNKEEFKNGTTKHYVSYKNEFKFSPRSCGFNKYYEFNSKNIVKMENGEWQSSQLISTTWEIGCNVEPQMLLDLYNKKKYNEAKYYHKNVDMVTGNKVKIQNNEQLKQEDIKIVNLKKETNLG